MGDGVATDVISNIFELLLEWSKLGLLFNLFGMFNFEVEERMLTILERRPILFGILRYGYMM